MLTLSERKRLQGLNGTVAHVKRTVPRYPSGFDDQDNLRAPRGIVLALFISLVIWAVAAWAWFA